MVTMPNLLPTQKSKFASLEEEERNDYGKSTGYMAGHRAD